MAIPLPDGVRALLDAPNYVHLSTLRADGSPRNWVVWIGVEDDCLLVCTGESTWKARDMRRDPRVGISVVDLANPYRMAAIQGRVTGIRPDEDCQYMDPISVKYTGAPFSCPWPGAGVLRDRRRESRQPDAWLHPQPWRSREPGVAARAGRSRASRA